MTTKPKLLVILGPHASGKTALSIELAKQFSGEIISADSRQVYKHMNLGTNKITPAEMLGVPHFGLDLVEPNQRFTVVDFQNYAFATIDAMHTRGKLPMLVGGTMLYIEAVVDNFDFPKETDLPLSYRTDLEQQSIAALAALLRERDPEAAQTIDLANKRRVIRALEILEATGKPVSESRRKRERRYDVCKLGIARSREETNARIDTWIATHVNDAMLAEVQTLHDTHGLSWERLESFGLEYRWLARLLQKKISHEDMIKNLQRDSHAFAKRQMTWWKRDKEIMWIEPPIADLTREKIRSIVHPTK